MKITVGLPFNHTFSFSGFSENAGYVLSGILHDGTTSTALEASLFSSVGASWTLSIPATATAAYTAGNATLYLIATKSSVETLVAQTPIKIEVLGTVSHNQTMVNALQSLMEGRTAQAYESLTTPEGESITRLDPEKLQNWLRFYEKRLASESTVASSGSRIKTIQMRCT